MHVSFTNTEGVMAMLMISWSGGSHIGFCHWTKFCTPSGKCCLRPLWTHINRQKKSVRQFHLKCYLVNIPPDYFVFNKFRKLQYRHLNIALVWASLSALQISLMAFFWRLNKDFTVDGYVFTPWWWWWWWRWRWRWRSMSLWWRDKDDEVVEHFKYIGSLKSADGNCSKDTRSRIGMAKQRMLDLVSIWRGINEDLKMKLIRSLVWTVLTYGAEGWTLTKADEKRIESAELWIYRRILRVSWTEHRTDESIITDLNTTSPAASRICCTSQTLLLWTHNQRLGMRAGEVCYPGESVWEAKAWKTKYVIQEQLQE